MPLSRERPEDFDKMRLRTTDISFTSNFLADNWVTIACKLNGSISLPSSAFLARTLLHSHSHKQVLNTLSEFYNSERVLRSIYPTPPKTGRWQSFYNTIFHLIETAPLFFVPLRKIKKNCQLTRLTIDWKMVPISEMFKHGKTEHLIISETWHSKKVMSLAPPLIS